MQFKRSPLFLSSALFQTLELCLNKNPLYSFPQTERCYVVCHFKPTPQFPRCRLSSTIITCLLLDKWELTSDCQESILTKTSSFAKASSPWQHVLSSKVKSCRKESSLPALQVESRPRAMVDGKWGWRGNFSDCDWKWD